MMFFNADNISQLLGLQKQPEIAAMHLQEIEAEAENVLELLTVLCTNMYHADTENAAETAAELTIALEHLQHHTTTRPGCCPCYKSSLIWNHNQTTGDVHVCSN